MGRESNRNYVRCIRLHEDQVQGLSKERTLHIEGVPPEWPSTVVAQYVLRVALENNCSYINVKKGVHSRQKYSVIDLLNVTQNLNKEIFGKRFLPRVPYKKVPRKIATTSQLGYGGEIGGTRPLILVPSLAPVSGLKPAGKKGVKQHG